METSSLSALLTIKLDMIQTTALGALVLFLGYFVKRRLAFLDRLNIPAPVVGGLIFATLALIFRLTNVLSFEFDTALQNPFMIAFFTTVGLTASFSLLKVGGPQVILFWGIASLLAFLQDGVGVLMSKVLGVHPFLGLITGSVTMTGGHGTGLAFGPLFEKMGMNGATTLAVAAATFGLVAGGLIGGPIGTYLIQKKKLRSRFQPLPSLAGIAPEGMDQLGEEGEPKLEVSAYEILKYMTIILACMWVGSLLSAWIESKGITLPAYIGAMLVAALVRNFFDVTKLVPISQGYIDVLGSVALNLFLAMALMSLRLWELLELALPMLVILCLQVMMMAGFALFITFNLMGRDYDAAVMAGGNCGFSLGATPNAIANMESLVEKFGPAPRAFLVIPIVGAFFIDFTNALIITFFINIVK